MQNSNGSLKYWIGYVLTACVLAVAILGSWLTWANSQGQLKEKVSTVCDRVEQLEKETMDKEIYKSDQWRNSKERADNLKAITDLAHAQANLANSMVRVQTQMEALPDMIKNEIRNAMKENSYPH